MALEAMPAPSELLGEFFHDVVVYGCGVVPEHKLKRWARRERLTPSFWQLINTECQKALDATGQGEQGYKLYMGEAPGAYAFIVWDGGERRPDSWWQSVETLSQSLKGKRLSDEDLKGLDEEIEKRSA